MNCSWVICFLFLLVAAPGCKKKDVVNTSILTYSGLTFSGDEVATVSTDSGLYITAEQDSGGDGPYEYVVIKRLRIFLRNYSGARDYQMSGCGDISYSFTTRGNTNTTCATNGVTSVTSNDTKSISGTFEFNAIVYPGDTVQRGGSFYINK